MFVTHPVFGIGPCFTLDIAGRWLLLPLHLYIILLSILIFNLGLTKNLAVKI